MGIRCLKYRILKGMLEYGIVYSDKTLVKRPAKFVVNLLNQLLDNSGAQLKKKNTPV